MSLTRQPSPCPDGPEGLYQLLEISTAVSGLTWGLCTQGAGPALLLLCPFPCLAPLALKAGWAHAVGREVEAALSSLILLEQIQHGALLKIRQGLGTLPAGTPLGARPCPSGTTLGP